MSTTDVQRFFTADTNIAIQPDQSTMLRNYAQLYNSLRFGRNQIVRNLTASTSATPLYRTHSTSGTPSNPDNLPHYPVPALNDVLGKYLRSVQPLLSADELQHTQRLCADFGSANGEGAALHAELQRRASGTENWLSDWWLKYGYLGWRAPVVVNSNPGLYYDVRRFSGDVDAWLSHAARTVWATMRFKEQIDAKEIPADRMGKALLDMAQYGRIFGTCRIPRKDYDGLEFNANSDYVVVAFRNGFHKLPVYDNKRLLTESELVAQLHEIVNDDADANPPIGTLTAEHRDRLAIAYEHLCKGNANAVKTIERALFVLCLDSAVSLTPDDEQTRHNVGSHQLIHGGGLAQNSANRWFDKTLQLIVNENGLIGLNYEHSPGEGQPIAVLSDFIISHTNSNVDVLKPKAPPVRPTKLTFAVDAELQRHLDAAQRHVDSLAGSLDMHVLDYTAYGKNFIKSQKMSPDSYIQMAMQFAFYKKHGVAGAHYETAQQRKFIHGRTETIRSCSVESVAFARAMCQPETSDADRVNALRAAVDGHKDYTVQAMNGAGVDRLLLGLKLVAVESGRKVPALFADDAYVRSTHYRISTSQVASQHRAFMCYGPAVPDGYGICYNPRGEDMLLAVSTFTECNETNARAMSDALSEALSEMYALLVRAGGSRPASKL